MTPESVAEALVRVHKEIQEDCGFDPAVVTPDCRPLNDLPGFDSMLIPGTVRTLARVLGRPFAKGTRVKNVYIGEDGRSRRTIREIAEAFCRHYPGEGNAK